MINGRGYLVLIFAAVLLLATCWKARAADLPPGIDCATVRQYVAEHGKAKALAWAISQGYSWQQIAAARKCLR